MNSKQKINGSSWLLLALMPALLLIPAFGMAQSSRTEKSSSPMSRSLDEMVAHIETAAKGAEVIQRAAPLYVRAQSQISDGDRIAALGSIREIQSVVQNTTDTQLIRSFSRELERILSSLNSAPDFFGSVRPAAKAPPEQSSPPQRAKKQAVFGRRTPKLRVCTHGRRSTATAVGKIILDSVVQYRV